MRQVTAYHQLIISDLTSSWPLVSLSVGPELDPIALCVEEPDYRTYRVGSSFHKVRADRPNRSRVSQQTYGASYVVNLSATQENYHHAQPLGPNRLLLVRSRAESESDPNAHVYNLDGEIVASFHAGDGIEDVQTTQDGRIWVSYFDEGVYGSLELGQNGAVCFERSGVPLLKYQQLLGPSSNIHECYAMNVASDKDVWLYYYTDFPLVRLRDGRFDREWKGIPVQGSRAFAVDGERALFAGSYDHPDKLFLVSLDTMRVEELEPVHRDGERVEFVRAFGRGSRLYLASEQALVTVELADC